MHLRGGGDMGRWKNINYIQSNAFVIVDVYRNHTEILIFLHDQSRMNEIGLHCSDNHIPIMYTSHK